MFVPINALPFHKSYCHRLYVKDSGNLSEECDYLLTLFNPTDEKYGLSTHFGYPLDEYPNYRSIHLVESRDTECPQHLGVQMQGNIKHFKTI